MGYLLKGTCLALLAAALSWATFDQGYKDGHMDGHMHGFGTGYKVGLAIPNGEKVGLTYDPEGWNSIVVETYEGICIYSGPGRFEAFSTDYPIVVQ